MTKFSPTQGKFISKSDLDHRCDAYRQKHPGCTEMSFIGSDELNKLLDTPGATGIWCINTIKDGRESLSFVAADINGNMLFPSQGKDPDRGILNDTLDCPPTCPVSRNDNN